MESSLSPDDVITHILLGDRKEDPDILSDIFWDAPATVNWFSEHGYTLYTRLFMYGIYREWTVPSLPFEDILESNYPYAGHDITDFYDNPQPLRTSDLTGKLAYAQDSELHHVAIKAIFNDSEEYRILRYLHAQGLDTLQENCIMPVLDILPYRRNLCFVVMPRWGRSLRSPESFTTLEVLDIIQSMLKGLTFLHSHNIVHHDIKMENMLISYYRDDGSSSFITDERRAERRAQGKLRYAIIDYDVSIMVPPEIHRDKYTLPYFKAWIGTWENQPYDILQAEYEYKPFAFDVGCAGVVFCNIFQEHERYIPMLAPLLDMMTTRDISRRFTAAQALRFVDDIRRPLTAAQLATPHVDIGSPRKLYFEYDRWQHLPGEFQTAWATYREPPEPSSRRFLRKVHEWISDHFSPHITPRLRWLFVKVAAMPRFMVAIFLGRIPYGYPHCSVWNGLEKRK